MDDKSQNSKKYSPTVQPIRDAYERSVEIYNASRESKVSKEIAEHKFEFKDSKEVENFSRWTNEQLTLLKNGIAMENAYQSFKQVQQKEEPIPNFNDQMKVSNEQKLKHIYRADDAIEKLSGVYKELNEGVRKFSREMNDAKTSNGENSKEFLEAKSKYDTAKYFRANIELNRALVKEEKFKSISELTGHKEDKKQYEAAKIESSKLKQELGQLYQEMNKSQKMTAAAGVDINSPPPKLMPPPVKQSGFQPIPLNAAEIAQNQKKVVEAQKALEDAKKEAKVIGAALKSKIGILPPPLTTDTKRPEEVLRDNIKSAREDFKNKPTKENYLKLNNAISKNNILRIENLENKIKNVGSEKDLVTILKKGMAYSKKIERLKEQNNKINKIEESLKAYKPEQTIVEKPKTFIEKLKSQFSNAAKSKSNSR